MKTNNLIISLALFAGPFVGAILYKEYHDRTAPREAQIKLEQILSIKELQLVRHTYNDLFFIYKQNDASKPIRAIASVPVSVTAHLNLKNIQIVSDNDSIRKVILPSAVMNDATYEMNNLKVTRLRAFQLHAGSDLYADVTQYIQQVLAVRLDSVREVAIRNHILEQAESEGKEYIETLLKAVGRPDIVVTFGDERKDKAVADVQLQQRVEKAFILKDAPFDNPPHGGRAMVASNPRVQQSQ